jgi:hypothetical protein
MPRLLAIVENHFSKYPQERTPVERFVDLFDLRWADHVRFERSEASFYLLKPKSHASELYGFERELLLVYSPYSNLEPRTLKQFEEVLARPQLKGRVEPLYMVLIAPMDDVEGEVARYRLDAEQGRIIVAFSEEELRASSDPWFLRRRFAKYLFSRDLFDIKQALVADSYFFGRQGLVLDLLDRLKRGENTGLYGLRKTGKTSSLFKLRRIIETESAGAFVYLDAQNPAIYGRRWWELASIIRDEAARVVGTRLDERLSKPFTASTATNRLQQSLEAVIERIRAKNQRLLIVIDEVEHIYPGLSPDKHWAEDFLPFWKLLRAIQTQDRRIAFIVAGVNSHVSEAPSVEGHDNPLFSLVGTRYLQPFTAHETKEMVQTLGRRMGILFENEACSYLSERYGGHPMLVRLACSWEHQLRVSSDYSERPVQILRDQLIETEAERELELVYYVRHVLDVLRIWYPEEYEILTLLAADDHKTFDEYATDLPESVQHLKAYGLIDRGSNTLTIGMVKRYLTQEGRRREREKRIKAASSVPALPALLSPPDEPINVPSILASGEGSTIEFKSTLRVNLHTGKPDTRIEHSVLKTIAALLNSDGGYLAIGVDDSGAVIGLSADGFASEDKMSTHLVNLIRDSLGAEHAEYIKASYHTIEGTKLLLITCRRSPRPVFLKHDGEETFYVRLLAATAALTVRQAQDYMLSRFGA